jgi:hypothetical protein
MTSSGDDHVVTLRDIYLVGIDTRQKVITLTSDVGGLKEKQTEIKEEVDKVSDRVSVLERGHSKIIGAAVAAATVAGTAVTIIGWVVTKGP